jgi:hypothetical protein
LNQLNFKEEEIELAIKNLKPGKSPDIDGISAEHYKNAMDELKPLILHILNTIIEELDIPQMLKRGIMTPVLKKNKDRQNPANFLFNWFNFQFSFFILFYNGILYICDKSYFS